MSKPKTQKLAAYCSKCKKDIEIEVLVNVPINVACEWMKLIRCPKCGAKAKSVCI